MLLLVARVVLAAVTQFLHLGVTRVVDQDPVSREVTFTSVVKVTSLDLRPRRASAALPVPLSAGRAARVLGDAISAMMPTAGPTPPVDDDDTLGILIRLECELLARAAKVRVFVPVVCISPSVDRTLAVVAVAVGGIDSIDVFAPVFGGDDAPVADFPVVLVTGD